MTDTLERLTTEVRKLKPAEVEELRAWLADYHPGQEAQPPASEMRVDWSDLPGRVKAIFGDAPPLQQNVVLALREEERF